VSPALSDVPVRKVIRALETIGFSHARTRAVTLCTEIKRVEQW
jgi:hypothetical protein